MNVGDPNAMEKRPIGEGVGDAHISEDRQKGKTARSEGALLQWLIQEEVNSQIDE